MAGNLVKCSVARVELGKPGPPIGSTRLSAIKRVLGVKGHYVPLDAVREFLAANPNFSEREVYHKKGCKCRECKHRGRGTASNRWTWRPGRKARSTQRVDALG